ncbi:MAG: hypothetical protein JWP87_6028 [Labilithrix sp.]|nr:hypothetical protein [Labilithrix sp.]
MTDAIADAPREKLIRSHQRWRWIFLLLAVLLPAALHAIFERQARRLDALADHGKTVRATVTDAATYVGYRYEVDGAAYSLSVSRDEAPFNVGQELIVSYLPEAPAFTRPTSDPSVPRGEAARNRSFARKVVGGAVIFFAINAALSELKLRRLRKRTGGRPDETDAFLVSPVWAGRFVGLLLVAILIGTNFYDDVGEVQRKAFGATPFGLPVRVAVSTAEVVLFAPYFWVFEHVMRIAYQALRDGASLSRSGLASYIWRVNELHPELRRSRAIAIAGLVYFAVLAAGWISFAGHRGV